jgi:peroxiredoxin
VNPSLEATKDELKSSRSSSRGVLILVIVALVVSVTVNVLLAHKVRSLTNAREVRIAERLLAVGTKVPPIAAKGLDGQEETISYGQANQTTVLYIFTPTCIWCARNMDNLKTLMGKESAEYRFIGLSLSDAGVNEYVTKNKLNFPVYSGLSPETVKTYKLSGTPQTIIISPEGKVLQDWAGAYVGDQKSQVEAFFHVTLPGIAVAPKPTDAKAGGS